MNNNYTKLSDLFIGNIDGGKESLREDFERLFYNQDDVYKDLLCGNKFLIVGRKGTGKTFLSNYIHARINSTNNEVCKICDSSEFTLQSLIELNGREFISGEPQIFWKWVICLQFSYSILNSHKLKSYIPFTKLNKLRKFIKNKYPDSSSPFKQTSFTTKKSSTLGGNISNTHSSINAQVKGEVDMNYQNAAYYDNLKSIYELILNILSDKKNKKITIIFDDLDCLNSTSKLDKFLVDLLTNLIFTTQKINSDLSKRKSHSKIILVLRDDILYHMHDFNGNINKIASSEDIVNLYWLSNDYNEPFEHPLMKLILFKIKSSTSVYNNLSDKQLYEKLFRKNIRGKSALKFLLDTSFGRPRDIIKYLNIIKSKYKDSGWFHPEYFKSCMQEYSNWFYNELRNEISIRSNSDFLKESLNLIKNVHKITFTFSDLENTFNKNPEAYSNITNLHDVIRECYSLGIIGTSYKSQNSNSKPHVSFAYRDDSDTEPDFSNSFIVHEGLRKKFSLY